MFPRSPMFMASLYVHHFISSYICNFIRFYSFFVLRPRRQRCVLLPFVLLVFLPQVICPEVPPTVGAVCSQGSGGGGV